MVVAFLMFYATTSTKATLTVPNLQKLFVVDALSKKQADEWHLRLSAFAVRFAL